MSNPVVLDTDRISDRAMDFKLFLEDRVIGQERAIKRLVQAYDFALSPMRNMKKPIIVAPYFGPSGVGKTFMARCVAEFFFENQSAMTKIDCTKFTNGHEVSLLVGSPPGYLGYDDKSDPRKSNPPMLSQGNIDKHASDYLSKLLHGNKSLEQIKERWKKLKVDEVTEEANPNAPHGVMNPKLRKIRQEIDETERLFEKSGTSLRANILKKSNGEYFSVILFDEFEKGHTTLHDNIMDIGSCAELVLMNKEVTSFVNSFIFLTSNIGSQAIGKVLRGGNKTMGFGAATQTSSKDQVYATVMGELKKYFKTEFLGRLQHDIVVFRPLRRKELEKILERLFEKICMDLIFKIGAQLIVGEDVKNHILEDAMEHPEYGARPLEQAIDHLVEKPLARLVTSGQIEDRDDVSLHMGDGKVVFTKTTRPPVRKTPLVKTADQLGDLPPFDFDELELK